MKQKMWVEKEVELLKHLFKTIPLQSCKNGGKSKFNLIKEKLKENGFDRTTKSISRKTYRLGLKNYEVLNEDLIEMNCSDCDSTIVIRKRYLSMYKNENFRCDVCREEHKKNWSKTDNGKKYHKEYLKNWRKNN